MSRLGRRECECSGKDQSVAMKNGWQEKPVGEILQLQYGKPLDKSDRKSNGRFPVYGANGEKDRTDKFYHDKSSIIVGRKGSAGEINLTEKKFWPLDVTYFVTFDNKQHDLRFLYYLLTTLDLPKFAKGVKPGINRNEVYSQVTKVPPLPEQRRIVGILDKSFDAIATAKANAEKNLRNARELFESYLETIFTQRGEGWVKASLGEVYNVRDGTHDSPKYHETGYPLITSKNLKHEGLSFDKVNLINEQDYNKINERSAVHKGDVLFAMIGTIGNPTRVTIEPKFAIKNVALFKIPPGQNGAFLKYYLDSGLVISKMTKDARGTTQKFVGLGYLRGFPINIPPLETQIKITEKLNELSEKTQYLEAIYQKKLTALDELKKSILKKAFDGQL